MDANPYRQKKNEAVLTLIKLPEPQICPHQIVPWLYNLEAQKSRIPTLLKYIKNTIHSQF